MSEPGVTVTGGGSIAVDTPAMQDAARRLEAVRDLLDLLRRRIEDCLADPGWGELPVARGAMVAAAGYARLADRELAETGWGLRAAADRYGLVERTITGLQQAAWAGGAAVVGNAARIGLIVAGPGLALLPLSAGGLVVASVVAASAAPQLGRTGHLDPQIDPRVLAQLRLALSSSDDLVRGFAFVERPADLVHDDPASPYGSAATAAVLAGLLPTADASIRLKTTLLPGRVQAPASLAQLGERVPEVAPGGTQLRLERYPMPGGRSRWIVYVCGTITFSPASGPEPFDLRSDLEGVGGIRSDSEEAVAAAMRAAGVRPDDPVLLVGHSQGALDAVRLSQRRVFDVRAVVTLGGPTGQLEVPQDVAELSVEHDEDVVPVLGGQAATGLHRLVVRRSLYRGGPPPGPPLVPFSAGLKPHALTSYRQTLALADESRDRRVTAFTRDVGPFLAAAEGRIILVRADRARRADSAVRPARGPRAVAATGR